MGNPTVIEMVHIFGTKEDDKGKIKNTLESDPSVLLASFVQFNEGQFSFLVTRYV